MFLNSASSYGQVAYASCLCLIFMWVEHSHRVITYFFISCPWKGGVGPGKMDTNYPSTSSAIVIDIRLNYKLPETAGGGKLMDDLSASHPELKKFMTIYWPEVILSPARQVRFSRSLIKQLNRCVSLLYCASTWNVVCMTILHF